MSEVNKTAEDEDNEFDIHGLFICEDYVEKSWTFGEYQQPLLCSNMCSTDHDLTGQIVWPASVLLSWFVYHRKDLFEGKCILELGAGCGLAGFFSSQFSDRSIITDGNDIVMNLLLKNKAHLNTSNTEVLKLMWGSKIEVNNLLTDHGTIDIIMGADVILWPNQVSALLFTIRSLLLSNSTAKCFISYIVRAHSTTKLVFETARRFGLTIDQLDVDSFVPEGDESLKPLEKMLLQFSLLDDLSMTAGGIEKEMNDYEKVSELLAAPC